MYLGKPGGLIEIPDPRPGVEMTADRQGATNTTLGGRYRVDYPGAAPRTYSLSWGSDYPYLTPEQYDVLESLYLSPGPYVLLPYSAYGRWNYAPRSYAPWTVPYAGDQTYEFLPGSGLYGSVGSPVAPGLAWSFQALVTLTTGTSPELSSYLDWYAADKSTLVTTTVGPTGTPATDTPWQLRVTGTAPSGAAYVVPRLSGTSMAAETSYTFSKAQLEIGQPTTPLLGRGCPLVSFSNLTMTYNYSYQISADATFVDVS